MNNNSCYLKYCFQSNIKGIQINTILDKSENLAAEQEYFPIKDIDKSSVDKIQMEMDCDFRRKKQSVACSGYIKLPFPQILRPISKEYKKTESYTCLIQGRKKQVHTCNSEDKNIEHNIYNQS